VLLGDPGRVSAGCSQGAPEAVASGRRCRVAPDMAWVAGVSVGRQVLVELIDIKGLHVGHYFMADLPDVHIAKIDVWLPPFPQGTPFSFGVGFACLQLSLRGGRRCGGPMALTCNMKNILRRKEREEVSYCFMPGFIHSSAPVLPECQQPSSWRLQRRQGERNSQAKPNLFISSCGKKEQVQQHLA